MVSYHSIAVENYHGVLGTNYHGKTSRLTILLKERGQTPNRFSTGFDIQLMIANQANKLPSN